MSITEEQRTIIHSQVDEILLVSAYAGSGKTFTLQRFAEAHRDSRILYLAFNKSMASEAGAKFAPLGVRTSTIHSLAFHAYGKRFTNLGNPRPHDLAAIADHLRPKNTTAAAALILQWINAYMSSAARVPSEYVAKASNDSLGPPRFLNRGNNAKGWLAPSLQHRVDTTTAWVNRMERLSPVSGIAQELVRFSMQQMENPKISGVEYQQGTLAGYETREYLLEKWGRECAYCGAKDMPLQIEHIHPKQSPQATCEASLPSEACGLEDVPF